MTGHFCGGRTHLLTQRNGGGGWGGQDGRCLKLREQPLLSWHAQPRRPLPTASPSREREEPERHKGQQLSLRARSPAGGGWSRQGVPWPGWVGLPVGGTSCEEPFPARCHRCGPGSGRRGSAAARQVPASHGSCGSPHALYFPPLSANLTVPSQQ